jgi:hypothetical protein
MPSEFVRQMRGTLQLAERDDSGRSEEQRALIREALAEVLTLDQRWRDGRLSVGQYEEAVLTQVTTLYNALSAYDLPPTS